MRQLIYNAKTQTESKTIYTQNEQLEATIANDIKRNRIAELKAKLKNYDYIGVKIATGRATKEDYATEIAEMTAWAAEISELEEN